MSWYNYKLKPYIKSILKSNLKILYLVTNHRKCNICFVLPLLAATHDTNDNTKYKDIYIYIYIYIYMSLGGKRLTKTCVVPAGRWLDSHYSCPHRYYNIRPLWSYYFRFDPRRLNSLHQSLIIADTDNRSTSISIEYTCLHV
jgi:hypothetical protein